MPIIDHPHWVRAIRAGVSALRGTFAGRGWYDSHDLANWLNHNQNAVLNEVIDSYRVTGRGVPALDPVHTATREIGNFLQDWMGQVKIGEALSQRQITLTNGTPRDGECSVSQWEISASTVLGNPNDRTAQCDLDLDEEGDIPDAALHELAAELFRGYDAEESARADG